MIVTRPATIWDHPLKRVGPNDYQIDEAELLRWLDKGWLILGPADARGTREMLVPVEVR